MSFVKTLSKFVACLLASTLPVVSAAAQEAPPAVTQQVPAGAPKLIVAIAIDQFSSDVFAQYRQRFTGGLARLTQGAVFPAGYQSHAATETCPGHSTILTGNRPAHTGVIANSWIDQSVTVGPNVVYCAEDVAQRSAGSRDYVASVKHLLVPTLGEWMKQANPAARNIAVSGKDRGALMMGGHDIDQVYWWKGKEFATLNGRAIGPAAVAQNAQIAQVLAKGAAEFPLPDHCRRADRAIKAGSVTIGNGHFALKAGDANGFRTSPRLDRATLDLALKLVDEQKLGKGAVPDVLSVSLSATDYIGHATGTEGAEMCIQMTQVDTALGEFFASLDKRGIDYAVVLTADHGGFDLPERLHEQALETSSRVSEAVSAKALSATLAKRYGLAEKDLVLADGPSGDYWLRSDLPSGIKGKLIDDAKALLEADPQVEVVLSAAEIAATPMPTTSADTWTLAERARASYNPLHSGDFVVFLKRGVVPIPNPGLGYVATHGSPWDYDRRVPILFWRKGLTGFEQPSAVEVVDIAPSLAALIGLKIPEGAFDGRCLDLDGGPVNTCGVNR
ncbi:MAG: alkaline phosphatase [Novosphingobium sp. 28-62-57]|uniref:alkaline phosphatase family protein n=1 Tax=unclassified Novosphingobium TaxID=2644732 RepID=UPI000BD0779F|nr:MULTISPECIES: alkaline phosphatase family protein [unclassified Novosphingobium]OYW47648.1 MAG: alkaline phosphatase [Novosphingobium sp. 12-63-9]OYZ08390.1 MAG: alkaline phosphatase [Novosphingobium sp. 28-62-57]OZA37688.1 MAG: alkaline phosphatase [Novosphingobium sp. 17-62-9]HQS68925.1 alkaline phosphatase family protein [Novosphingobium sp.]